LAWASRSCSSSAGPAIHSWVWASKGSSSAAGGALVLEALGLLLGGELDRVVVARERGLALRDVGQRGVGDDVWLPVVEVELRRVAHPLDRLLGVLNIRKADPNRVLADSGDLRLGNAQRVRPLPDDLDRPIHVVPLDLRVLRGRATLVDQLGAALEVRPSTVGSSLITISSRRRARRRTTG
jgi:hypothetical protein